MRLYVAPFDAPFWCIVTKLLLQILKNADEMI